MNKAVLLAGVVGMLLGGLWLRQGLGIVHIQPILCFADCGPVQGASLIWAIAGFFLLTVGILAIFFSRKWRTRR